MALQITILVAALLCGLVAGLVLGFALVVMPGIAALEDRDYLRAFQAIDGVIQRGQPVFGLVWLGSALAVVLAMALGGIQLAGPPRLGLWGTGAAYLLGVQLPTIVVNIPLNNALQTLDLGSAEESVCREARLMFEGRWNRWNVARTLVATGVTAGLMGILALL